MTNAICAFLDWLAATNHSPATVANRRSALMRFAAWCTTQGIFDPHEVTTERLERYRLDLYRARRPPRAGEPPGEPQPLGWGTQAEHLGSVRGFVRWCHGRGLAHADAAGLALPRRPVQLPRVILSPREVERVLAGIPSHTVLGLRDRAMLEVLYSTGIRRAELAGLRLTDVHRERGALLIRAGKGQRDRVVPLGSRAVRWIDRYLRRARPALARGLDPGYLFLTQRGRRFRLNRLSERVRGHIEAAGLAKSGSCHLFRHTMATLLLDGGAGIRDVQEILGHVNLSTTARYTHISIERLKAVHARAHPGERRGRRG